jgi:acyl carrier protein
MKCKNCGFNDEIQEICKVDELSEKIIKILTDIVGLNAKEITLDIDLKEDLLFDSLDIYETLMHLEDKFNISISDDEAGIILASPVVKNFAEIVKSKLSK